MEDSEREVEDNVNDDGVVIMPSTKTVSTAENWVHIQPNILKNNRTSHMDPELEEGDERDPEDVKKLIEQADPFEPRLKPISKDFPITVSETHKQSAWVVKLQGDKTDYIDDKTGKVTNYGVVVVKNL